MTSQTTLQTLACVKLLHAMDISGETKLLAVIGNPIAHSASPAMHNAAIQFLGLDMVYFPLFLDSEKQLKAVMATIRATNFVGVNVTIPYKEKVVPFLDDLTPQAMQLQAVNTIVKNKDGRLMGHNTDGDGFLYALHHEGGVELIGKTVSIIGAGGAARAIALAVSATGIKAINILNRHRERAENIEQMLHKSRVSCDVRVAELLDLDVLKKSDLVINTTPLGMQPNIEDSVVQDFNWVSDNHFCCDIIYKPQETKFLRMAKARGATVLGGAGMLAGQGVLAFQLFTEKEVPYTVMRSKI